MSLCPPPLLLSRVVPLRERSLPSVRFPVERLTGRQGRGRGARRYGASAAGEKREATHCVTCNVDSIQCVQCVKCVQCVRCAASPIGSNAHVQQLSVSPSVSPVSLSPVAAVSCSCSSRTCRRVGGRTTTRRPSSMLSGTYYFSRVERRLETKLKPFIAVARRKSEKREQREIDLNECICVQLVSVLWLVKPTCVCCKLTGFPPLSPASPLSFSLLIFPLFCLPPSPSSSPLPLIFPPPPPPPFPHHHAVCPRASSRTPRSSTKT